MKTKTKVISIVLSISVLMLLVSCQKQKAEWKGTIEEVDGVTIVKNPKEPMYGEDVFRLKEDLIIEEKEGNEEYLFSLIYGVEVDDEENIYVLDLKEANIKVFNKGGEYLTTIGKKGQGPGEVGKITSININSKGELVVSDIGNQRISFFDLKGKYIRSLNMTDISFVTFSPEIDSHGNYYDTVVLWDKPFIELQKFNSELEYLLTFDSFPRPAPSKTVNPYKPRMYFTVTNDDLIICSYTEKYEIKFFNSKGILIKKIIKNYNPVQISEEVKQEDRKIFSRFNDLSRFNLVFPKYYEALYSLNVDEEGRLYVGTYEKSDNKYIYDVFDADGKFITRIPLKEGIVKFKNNKLYSVGADEEGYYYLKRYKVAWKY